MTLLSDALGLTPDIPEPYYRDPQAEIELYLGDCREWIGRIEPSKVSLLVTDPPYGMNAHVRRGLGDTKKLQRVGGEVEIRSGGQRGRYIGAGVTVPWDNVVGDNRAFDPIPLLRFPRVVLWGANHYANRLPNSPSWIIWDKVDGLISDRTIGFNDNADCELAWTNLGGPARIIRHRWMGAMKASARTRKRVHETEKPVALSDLILLAWTKPGDLILDPYCGSGPIAASCKKLGRRYIGFEIKADHLESAKDRLAQNVLPLEWKTQEIEVP
jgi:site-specific DNA-methyltransferase (adenine-specific)/modification methylase